MMNRVRFLVFFASHPEPPADFTFVDVRAPNALAAVAKARKKTTLHHGWSVARAIPWPAGCVDVDAATQKLAGRRS